MKRVGYIAAFMLLGILLSFLVHVGLEVGIVWLLETNFSRYNLGLSWEGWFAVHRWGSLVLLLTGAAFGVWAGRHYWPIVYQDKSNPTVD